MLQVVERIDNNLVGESNELNLETNLLEDTVLIAHDLSPANTVHFKEQRIAGFVTDAGGPTSHTAILGRSLAIPSVIGLRNARDLISENEWVIVDGINGVLIINPDDTVLAEYRGRHARIQKPQTRAQQAQKLPPPPPKTASTSNCWPTSNQPKTSTISTAPAPTAWACSAANTFISTATPCPPKTSNTKFTAR